MTGNVAVSLFVLPANDEGMKPWSGTGVACAKSPGKLGSLPSRTWKPPKPFGTIMSGMPSLLTSTSRMPVPVMSSVGMPSPSSETWFMIVLAPIAKLSGMPSPLMSIIGEPQAVDVDHFVPSPQSHLDLSGSKPSAAEQPGSEFGQRLLRGLVGSFPLLHAGLTRP